MNILTTKLINDIEKIVANDKDNYLLKIANLFFTDYIESEQKLILMELGRSRKTDPERVLSILFQSIRVSEINFSHLNKNILEIAEKKRGENCNLALEGIESVKNYEQNSLMVRNLASLINSRCKLMREHVISLLIDSKVSNTLVDRLLIKSISDSWWVVRCTAIEGIGVRNVIAGIDPMIMRYKKTRNIVEKNWILYSLCFFSGEENVVSFLESVLEKSKTISFRLYAAIGLFLNGDDSYFEYIIKYIRQLRKEDFEVYLGIFCNSKTRMKQFIKLLKESNNKDMKYIYDCLVQISC